MKNISLKKAAALALFGLVLSASVAGAAQARDYDHGRGWHRPPIRHWHGPHEVYAPPVVYAPPPPVEESSGINLILPLHFH